jgi:hypothetical protein
MFFLLLLLLQVFLFSYNFEGGEKLIEHAGRGPKLSCIAVLMQDRAGKDQRLYT